MQGIQLHSTPTIWWPDSCHVTPFTTCTPPKPPTPLKKKQKKSDNPTNKDILYIQYIWHTIHLGQLKVCKRTQDGQPSGESQQQNTGADGGGRRSSASAPFPADIFLSSSERWQWTGFCAAAPLPSQWFTTVLHAANSFGGRGHVILGHR